MKRWMQLLLSLVLATSVLAGCAGTPANNTQSPAPESSPSAAAPSEPTPTPAATPEAAWPRTIVDATGAEIVLEKEPERVTLLHVVYLEHLLALGTPPTAAALGNAQGAMESLEVSELYAPYLAGKDITMLGNSKDLSVEAVLASEPDVIITFYNPASAELVEQLAEIAPVVQISYADTWQNQLMLCAQVLGKETEAETVTNDVEKIIADTKEVLAPYADRTFGLFRTDGKSFIAQGTAQFYKEFGLTKPSGFTDKADTLSLEAVAEMNPYYIVFQHNVEVTEAFIKSMEDNTVWQSLDAVKNGRVYIYDENMNSFGPLSFKLGAEKITALYTE
ncbi:Oligopeptide ABC transporter, oligopeptide-binding protein [uncultured Eubacteriales bacterium]|uniref:Oligopeptide ABC transporter, oligopeptide-binding protein n=1 Tax=uncultured Eubacteriales bacterium TaxID=172733 RepID=A0A212JG02_9FIRM|nr:Oligopeptide ABC transporter, oligopeptide-binding protein [uncultured Eubacteriales bacterium]